MACNIILWRNYLQLYPGHVEYSIMVCPWVWLFSSVNRTAMLQQSHIIVLLRNTPPAVSMQEKWSNKYSSVNTKFTFKARIAKTLGCQNLDTQKEEILITVKNDLRQ